MQSALTFEKSAVLAAHSSLLSVFTKLILSYLLANTQNKQHCQSSSKTPEKLFLKGSGSRCEFPHSFSLFTFPKILILRVLGLDQSQTSHEVKHDHKNLCFGSQNWRKTKEKRHITGYTINGEEITCLNSAKPNWTEFFSFLYCCKIIVLCVCVCVFVFSKG